MVVIKCSCLFVFFFNQKTAYEMRISDWSSDVCSSDLEDLVDFMLGDLNDKLRQVSRLDILEAVDDQAMNYFQSLPIADVTDAALAQRAKALEKIGSVRQDQGHLPAAMASYQAAAKLAAALAEKAPADTTRQLAYARVLAFVGMTHWYQGQLDAAQQSFESAQTVLQRRSEERRVGKACVSACRSRWSP